MRNLRLFIVKNYFFFLFLIFQLVSLAFLVSSNDYQRTSFLNSSNNTIGYIMEKTTEISDYIHLKEANKLLQEENAHLRSLTDIMHYEIHKGQLLVGDSNSLQQYFLLPAKVINNSVSMQDNYLTLNRGSNDGVGIGMGVTNGNSIVGFVMNVSEHYATVMSVLNKNFALAVKLKKTNDFGSLIWEGTSSKFATLVDVPVDAPVSPGDTIVTKGASARFPENILVGIVEEVQLKPGSMHHHIIVNLSTNFNALYHVYVIDNKFAAEQKALEATIENPTK